MSVHDMENIIRGNRPEDPSLYRLDPQTGARIKRTQESTCCLHIPRFIEYMFHSPKKGWYEYTNDDDDDAKSDDRIDINNCGQSTKFAIIPALHRKTFKVSK